MEKGYMTRIRASCQRLRLSGLTPATICMTAAPPAYAAEDRPIQPGHSDSSNI